jgi:hypothetical protein
MSFTFIGKWRYKCLEHLRPGRDTVCHTVDYPYGAIGTFAPYGSFSQTSPILCLFPYLCPFPYPCLYLSTYQCAHPYPCPCHVLVRVHDSDPVHVHFNFDTVVQIFMSNMAFTLSIPRSLWGGVETSRGSLVRGVRSNQLKISMPLFLRETYQFTQLSAKPISLYSPFKSLWDILLWCQVLSENQTVHCCNSLIILSQTRLSQCKILYCTKYFTKTVNQS